MSVTPRRCHSGVTSIEAHSVSAPVYARPLGHRPIIPQPSVRNAASTALTVGQQKEISINLNASVWLGWTI